jgi:hypothetical protein
VRRGRRDDAHQVYVVTGNQFTPAVYNVTNFEFIGNAFRALTMSARNRYDTRSNAIFESGNLCRAGKTGAYYTYTNDSISSQAVTPK